MISGVKRTYEVPMAFVVMKLYLACRCCWMYRVKIAWLLDDWSFMLVLAVVRLKAPLFRQDIVSSSDRTARVVTPTWKKTKDKLTVWMSDYPGSHLVHFFTNLIFLYSREQNHYQYIISVQYYALFLHDHLELYNFILHDLFLSGDFWRK